MVINEIICLLVFVLTRDRYVKPMILFGRIPGVIIMYFADIPGKK